MQVRHNITLDDEVSQELEAVVKELGEKKSSIIEKALTVYFDLILVIRIGHRKEIYWSLN